jgi:predicted dehydrogenase
MDPAYAYHGNKLRITRVVDGKDQTTEIPAGKTNQFTLMIDHFASCIQQNKDVHTPGEEGLQDQRIMDAIYESARSGRVVKLKPPAGKTRGPEPESAD